MNLLRSRFTQAVVVLVLAALVFKFAIRPPAPWSVFTLYMFIVSLAMLVYVSSDSDSWRDFLRPMRATLVEPRLRVLRTALLIAIPLLLGYYAYTQAAAKPQAPPELRAVHPAPPASIQFRGKEINISGVENPLRKDAAAIARHVAAGRDVYVRNCVYCHCRNPDGKGHSASASTPPPANVQDPGPIAMLQEAFLFWRIAKGGPGLPKESTPWNSVMPAWEDRLTEEQIWQVIMFLYDFTGQQPRRWEASEHASH